MFFTDIHQRKIQYFSKSNMLLLEVVWFVLGFVVTEALDSHSIFLSYISKFNFTFGIEFENRLHVFSENLNSIETFNAATNSVLLGVNQFSHLSLSEFESQLQCKKSPNSHLFRKFTSKTGTTLPTSVDWVQRGVLNPIKNEMKCSSSWAFASVCALESAYFLKHGHLETYSEQALISCDFSNMGCNGGSLENAFDFIKRNSLPTTAQIPYHSGSNLLSGTCSEIVSTQSSSVDVVSVESNSDALAAAVSIQPVAITIKIPSSVLKSYLSGVLSHSECDEDGGFYHAAVVVGYGTDPVSGLDYWTLRNSWGPSWGENGYLRIEKSDANLCGVLDNPILLTL
jgi:C1A family cysteine protease